MYNKTSEVSK